MYFTICLSLATKKTPCSVFYVQSHTLRVPFVPGGEARKCKDI